MRWLVGLFVCVPLLGCRPELPPLDHHGERVKVGSDGVDQVCEGTLLRLDREVEQIEARLDLSAQASRLEVYVVDRDTVDAYCSAVSCTFIPWRGAPFVIVDQQKFERAITHELVHARLVASRSIPLFKEGIAEALSPPSCTRPAPDIELSEVLAARKSFDLLDVHGAYYVAGELIAWLLDEFGSDAVMSLLKSLGDRSSPSTVRAQYRELFDRELEDDLLAHIRTRDDLDALPPEQFGCLAPLVNWSADSIQLHADLDCDSDRVHNDFGIDGAGHVEWTIALERRQTMELVGEIPSGTSLTIEKCGCIPWKGEDDYLLARPLETPVTLQPGTYRLRWTGDLDEAPSLDVELVPVDD